MLTAKDENALEKARYLAAQAKDDPLLYTHKEVGYNYRMTNLQAAMGSCPVGVSGGFYPDQGKQL